MKNCLLFLFLTLLGPELVATTYWVTDPSPSGPGTLLDRVNIAVSGDIIRFDPVTDGIPIVPATTLNVSQNIRIIGNGCGVTIISGGGTQQIMRIAGASLAPGSVLIRDLTMQRGNSPVNGGAIEAFGAGLRTLRVCFEGNIAQGTTINEGGGAVYIIDGNLQVIQSSFTGNATINNFSTGGGIHFANGLLLRVHNSDFRQNRASIGGGGIVNEGATTTLITDSRFQGNGAGPITGFGFGGGIYSFNPSLSTVRDCQFDQNNAFAAGGAIFNATGTMRVQTCKFDNNQTFGGSGNNGGGGIANVNASLDVTAMSEFINNRAGTGYGGGLLNFGNGIVRVADSRLANNVADLDGGGVADLSVGGELRILTTDVSGNTSNSGNGGGIFVKENLITRVTDSNVGGNVAKLSGGGLYVGVSNFAMRNTPVQQNQANDPSPGAGGGGLFTTANPTNVRSCSFTGNQATDPASAGGGINASPGAVIRIWDGSDISSNFSGTWGGGLQLNTPGSIARVEDSEILFNATASSASMGGGVNVGDLTEARIFRCVTGFNKTVIRGGGINVENDGTLIMREGQVINNECQEEGGGIYTHTGSTNLRLLSVFDNQVQASSVNGGGGGYYNLGGSVTIRQCSFYRNIVNGAGGGGGIRNWDGSNPIAIYTTVSNNFAAFGGGIQSGPVFRGRNITVTENIPSGMDGQGNLRRSIVHDNFGTDFTGAPFSGTNNVLVGPYSALGGGNIFVPTASLLPLGPTLAGISWAHIPDCGSAAIAAAIGGGGTDQNNQPVVGLRDIGAHEVQAGDPSCPAIAAPNTDEVFTAGSTDWGEGFSVFPNPARSGSELKVAVPEDFGRARVMLSDLTGRTLLDVELTPGGGQLNLPGQLAAGTYLLRFVADDNAYSRKLQVID